LPFCNKGRGEERGEKHRKIWEKREVGGGGGKTGIRKEKLRNKKRL
jgi:hypothetical protein